MNEYRRKNCRFPVIDAAVAPATAWRSRTRAWWAAGVDPNRNYGAFWGGNGSSDTYVDAGLPRPRPVLGAGVAEHPRARLEPPGHDADHEPHVLGPRAAPARRRRAGHDASTSRSTRRSATRWRPRTATRASTATSCTTRPARPRTGRYNATGGPRLHVRDRPPRLPPAVRGDRAGVERAPPTTPPAEATAPRTTWRRRTRPTRASTRCSPARRRPGRCCGCTKTFETADLAGGQTFHGHAQQQHHGARLERQLRVAREPVHAPARSRSRADGRPRVTRARRSSSSRDGGTTAVRELRHASAGLLRGPPRSRSRAAPASTTRRPPSGSSSRRRATTT